MKRREKRPESKLEKLKALLADGEADIAANRTTIVTCENELKIFFKSLSADHRT
jgi:hypothetical protein